MPVDPRIRYGVLPLRIFLGATFVYAGVQKLTDPGFLSAGGRTYIGKQLTGFASQSPLGGLLTWFGDNVAVEVGVGTIIAEIAIGLGVLAGLWTRWCAIAGALASIVLFLSATWSVQPFFLGSDSLYAVAWVTLALVGDQGIFVPGQRFLAQWIPGRAPRRIDTARRTFLLRLGGGVIGTVYVLGLIPRGKSSAGVSASGGSATTTDTSSTVASPPAQATKIGTMAQLQSAGSLTYTDPASGDPAVVVGLGAQSLAAYDAVCTHAGCTVQWDPAQKVLFCPCHGAAFDAANNAAVLQGPAPSPLPKLQVTVTADGGIYTGGSPSGG